MNQIGQLRLSIEQKKALQAHYQATNNRRWQERIQCVLLKGQGLTLAAIAEVIPYNINTLSSWIHDYDAKGLEGLLVWEYAGSPAHLTPNQQQILKSHVEQTGYGRVVDVMQWVEQQWQVHYSEDGMREMLHNLGFMYQKGQNVPGK